jgi:hypothetical protein
MGDQEFDTFFMVYIKFVKVAVPKIIDSKTFYEYSFKLKIQNYKGAVTIGFINNQELELMKRVKNEIKSKITLRLCAFHYNEEEEINLISDRQIDKKWFLETRYDLFLPPGMFNSQNTMHSTFLYPTKYRRDGDSYIELGEKLPGQQKFTPINDPLLVAGRPPFGICSPRISKLI